MNKSTSWKWAVPAGILMSGMIFAGCAGTGQDKASTAAQPGNAATGSTQTGNTNTSADTTASTNTGKTDSTNTASTDQTTGSEQATGDSGNASSSTAGGSSATDSSSNGAEQSDNSSAAASDTSSNSQASSNASTSDNAASLLPIREQSSLQSTIAEKGGKMVVTNPESITVIVNKKRSLPDGYIPPDLVVPNVAFSYSGVLEKSHMRKEAAQALEQMFAASKKAGLDLRAVSGYRSYKRQVAIYKNNVATKGQAYTDRVSARPGTSEHQTGLAIDVSGPGIGYGLEQSFGSTKEGKWLKQHAPEYGFIIRYTEKGQSSTGYTWEPWHIRYIGKAIAEDVTSKGMTLEQYFDEKNIKS